MIRNVDSQKAVLAGVAGAAAMQAAVHAFKAVGIHLLDFTSELAAIVGPGGSRAGQIAGFAAHAGVAIAWALIYAYFFEGRTRWRPPVQGLAFSTIPAVLAIVFVYPQLKLMQDPSAVAMVDWRDFARLSPSDLLGIVAVHAIYGLVLGSIYTRPVGYRVGGRPKGFSPPRDFKRSAYHGRDNPSAFIFATGIECSYPTIEMGRWRRDELESTLHYRHWQEDFDLCRQLGITHLRYGPPLHLIFADPGQYDWQWADEPMAELERHGPEPIVDLCHFGVPDWLGSLQNPEIESALADYAGAFAERYPWVRFYTPVNEMYVCSRMSALDGNWNEQRHDDQSFVQSAFNLAGASTSMSDAILERRPDAIFVNSESSEFTQPCCPEPEIRSAAQLDNERRFLPLDLIFAHELSEPMKAYVRKNGKSDRDLARFANRRVPRRSVLGLDYYEWNERLLDSHGRARALGELFGWYVIAKQYYDRYQRPMMHTETNRMDGADAPRWLWRQWHNVQLMRKSGVPLIGFTWYSLTDQIDWNIALSEALGLVYPVGLFDLNRDVRTVGLAYKQLIEMYSGQPEFRECDDLRKLMA